MTGYKISWQVQWKQGARDRLLCWPRYLNSTRVGWCWSISLANILGARCVSGVLPESIFLNSCWYCQLLSNVSLSWWSVAIWAIVSKAATDIAFAGIGLWVLEAQTPEWLLKVQESSTPGQINAIFLVTTQLTSTGSGVPVVKESSWFGICNLMRTFLVLRRGSGDCTTESLQRRGYDWRYTRTQG